MNWRTVLDSFFSAFNQSRTISFVDVLDILIVAYTIYRIMKLLKDTSAERLIKGIIILVGIMLLASMLHLTMIFRGCSSRRSMSACSRSWSCFSLSCAVCSSRSARATSAG